MDQRTWIKNVSFKHFSDSSEEISTNLKYINPKILALRAISFLYFFLHKYLLCPTRGAKEHRKNPGKISYCGKDKQFWPEYSPLLENQKNPQKAYF